MFIATRCIVCLQAYKSTSENKGQCNKIFYFFEFLNVRDFYPKEKKKFLLPALQSRFTIPFTDRVLCKVLVKAMRVQRHCYKPSKASRSDEKS